MAASSFCKISAFVFLLLLFISLFCPVQSVNYNDTNQNFRAGDQSKKMKFIRDHLRKINKPAVKTIEAPPPPAERPRWCILKTEENLQLWSMVDEFCPQSTITIRRTS